VKNITKRYGRKQVLAGAGFEAEAGECIALCGLNGSGKSTLLAVLAGTLSADSGEFIVNGTDILKSPSKKKGLIGYVPQENPLMGELSARDNLRLWYCDSEADLDTELESGILHRLGIDAFADVRVDKLSGGMKKRVSLGCALSYDPAILILDEPGAALDLECRETIKQFVREHKERKGTVIIATHEEPELRMCDRLLVMEGGVLREESGILAEPAPEAALLSLLKNRNAEKE